jgi:predicted RNA-binding Zn-ribbon protein involved in translation (DUF1610 family)
MRKQEARTLYSIACACGAKASLDARSFGRPRVCPKCGNSFTVAWAKDPVTLRNAPVAVALAKKRPPTPLLLKCSCGYKRAVTAAEAAQNSRCPGCGKSMIVEKSPAAKSKDSNRIIKLSSAPVTLSKPPALPPPPAPPTRTDESSASRLKRINPLTPPPAFNKPGLLCECGKELEVVKALGIDGTTCPACGRTVQMETIRNPQSKHTVIRPRFGPKTDTPAAAPPKPAPEAMFDGPTAEFVEEPDLVPAPLPASYQEVFCPCGEALMIGAEDAGKNIQCPTCLTLIAVEQIRDTKTNHSALRVRAIGKMDQDTWSLSDFA